MAMLSDSLNGTIPVVDFGKCAIDRNDAKESDYKEVGKLIYEAFSTIGFVYLKNTGIARKDIEDFNGTFDQFYDLDIDVKRRFPRDFNKCFGYTEVNGEKTNPERPGDYKESFDVSGTAITSHATTWPDEYVLGFSDSTRQFAELCKRLAVSVLQTLTYGLSVKDKTFLLRSHSRMNDLNNFTILRSLHYPPVADDSVLEPGQLRLGEHSDYGSFTLLFQDNMGGLQIQRYDGNYFDAVPIPDTVLVNIGDALQFWTKGRLKSTKHRIVMPESDEKRRSGRRSTVYFVHPDHEVLLSEIEYDGSTDQADNSNENDCSEPLTAFEHVTRQFQNSYF